MFARLSGWLNDRTSFRGLIDALLLEHIPGGAKWRYVWGSCLSFVFGIQLITGILLMTAYSAGDSTAWSSVWYIQYQMDFGWFLRGLHHFGSQAMVVLLGVHMLQVVIAGAHLPPREINWWLGLGLMAVVLALGLTGYLLPWDQKGYWATQVATNIAGSLPVLGPWVQQVIVGGPEYGHHTLTRFYALHVGVLPPLLIVLLIAHIAVFRKHGVTTPKDAEGEGWFWPDQAFRDMLVSMIIFAIMIVLVLHGHGHKTEPAADKWSYDYWAHAGRDGLGANLDSPADPSNAYPARPEWYFLSLFQLLKYFEGDQKIVGTVIIPHAAAVLLFLLPLFGYGRMRPLGHILGVIVVVGLLSGVGALTLLALSEDTVFPLARVALIRSALYLVPLTGGVLLLVLAVLAVLPRGGFRSVVGVLGGLVVLLLLAGTGTVTYAAMETDKLYLEHERGGGDLKTFTDSRIPGPVADWLRKNMSEDEKEPLAKAETYQRELVQANKLAHRVVNAAGAGVPAQGGIALVRRDPLIAGRKLFEKKCATCHTYGKEFDVKEPRASDLKGFGREEWIYRLLLNPGHPDFFGRPRQPRLTEMDGHIKEYVLRPDMDEEELEENRKKLRTIAQWLARHPRSTSKDADTEEFKEGLKLFRDKNVMRCNSCHAYEGTGGTSSSRGPDLTGYADAKWLAVMILAPDSKLRYPKKNQMTAFRDPNHPWAELAELDSPDRNKKTEPLTDAEREMIIRFILDDPNVVFGGDPIAPSLRKP